MKPINLINKESSDSLETARKSKIYFLPLNKLFSNPLNKIYEDYDSEKELEELIDSIAKTGLQHPITVSKADDSYVIIDGHRRVKAIKRLLDKKHDVLYNGLRISDDSFPVIIMYVYESKRQQFEAMTAANVYRSLDKNRTAKLIEQALEFYNEDLEKGIVKPGLARDNIADIANLSGRTVQRYVDVGKRGEPAKMIKDQTQMGRVPSNEELENKELKKIEKYEKYYTDFQLQITDENVGRFQSAVIPLISLLMQLFHVDKDQL